MKKLLNEFLTDESGATAIEYGLIAALIGISIIVGGKAMGDALNTKFECTAEILDSETNSTTCS